MKFDEKLLGKKVRIVCIEDEPCDVAGEVFGLDSFFGIVGVIIPFEQVKDIHPCFDVDLSFRKNVYANILDRMDILLENSYERITEINEGDFPCTVYVNCIIEEV